MNLNRNSHKPIQAWARTWQPRIVFIILLAALLASSGLPVGVLAGQPAQAAGVNLTVVDYYSQAPLAEFDFVVNLDNAGDPFDPGNLPSMTPMESNSPVMVTGDETNWASQLASLPDGRYLISVRNDAFKLGGKHFTVTGGNAEVLVELVPEPLPLSKIRVHVFEDDQPVNGTDDIPVETGLAGFRVFVEDTVGEVVVDWFGNPICGTGQCLTDANGDVIIDNLPRGKYEVLVLPPVGQVSSWVQTTTIEGTKVIDAWIVEGDQGFSPREGFQQAAVWVGFIRQPADPWDGRTGTGTIRGTARTLVEWTPPVNSLVLGQAMDRPWVAVTDIGGNDRLVYLARGDTTGYFEINGVPDGTYQLAFWDEPLDYIMGFRTAVISGGNVVDFGELGVPRWFGWQSGTVYLDQNRDGIFQAGEPPLPGVELAMRFRDGSIRYGTFTGNDGQYEFPEVFELEKFYVSEVGFTNLGFTSALVHNEFLPYDPNNPASYAVIPGALTVSNLNWAAKRNVVDWGKHIYVSGENGGISGIVQYATTRNELEARLQATEDYEPGIPDVTVRLWEMVVDANGNPILEADGSYRRGLLLNEVQTDHFAHPAGCDTTDSTGAPQADPLSTGPSCIEIPNISNEVKEGVFDGGYAFATVCPGGFPCNAADEIPMPPNDYIVEVVPPVGYKIVTEEDLNTADGNDLVPAIPPPPCVGPTQLMQVPDVYGSPFDAFSDAGDPIPGVPAMPFCTFKMVTLQQGQNTAADFYLMTDNAVPLPGRVFGFLLDDLNIETNPAFIYYGEKRGVPFAPVGVYDFTGRLITTVHSDQNGIWEVLLPSSYAADCPIPSGICPGVYKFVGNDPGTPANPNLNYNPNYQTITFQFDVWPGKTTFADVALFSIVSFVEFPGQQTGQPAACLLPAATPQVYTVSPPYGGNNTAITITGNNFGTGGGSVTLDGDAIPIGSWTNTQITATVSGVSPGAHQLLVTSAGGETSLTGITFHRTGGGYNPDVVVVSEPANPSTPVIQNAIDNASGRTLIVVQPGTYYQAVNLNKRDVKLQGYGPGDPGVGIGGGGTVIDQRFVTGGINGLNITGPANGFNANFPAQIDGFKIMAARDEQDVGGGLHVDQNGRNLLIGNNLIQSNGGNLGGGITLGLPYRGDNNNDNVRIHHNRIQQNGGISLAGGLGIYNGADNYEIDHNFICGNYSAEYGGGISHFGYSQGGSIHHNQIVYNGAFDEGGGIIIAGEQPLPPATLTAGSGNVEIYNNLIQSNLSNDDGGGIRTLQPLDDRIDIYNNMIVNNVATDFGGGIALDDSSNVNIVNNTIARNVSTATAEDSDGLPHAAGLAAEGHSPAFQSTLGGGAPTYADPVLFNNIICENEAYTWDGVQLVLNGFFDLEVFSANAADVLHPTYSLLGGGPNEALAHGSNGSCGNLGSLFANPYNTTLSAVNFRQEPNFITVTIVTVELPATSIGDYHIAGAGPTQDQGTGSDPLGSGVTAPCFDFDDDGRGQQDIGADETGGGGGGCAGPAPANGVDLAPPSLNITGVDGANAILSHAIHNTGDFADTYDVTVTVDLGWPATFTTPLGPIAAGDSLPLDIAVGIPAGTAMGTIASVSVTVTSQSDNTLSATAVDTITVSNAPALPPVDLYLSLDANASSLGSLTGVHRADILGYSSTNDDYVMLFDASDVGIPANQNLDAFDLQEDGSILMSFSGRFTLPGIGRVNDTDILRFTPDAPNGLGPNTAGAFSMFVRGADIGLAPGNEDVDAISMIEGDMLVVSTNDDTRVPGLPGVFQDEDLLLYVMQDETNPGGGGTWSLYFDGSDVGLGNGSGENVDGLFIPPGGGVITAIYFSTAGNFNVPGLSGGDEDIFVCALNSLGQITACSGFSRFFDGSAHGITNTQGRDIDAFDLPNQ